jgi:glutathione S-transferase
MSGAPDRIVLHQPPAMMGVPNISPFCAKLETWLRLADIPYRVRPTVNPARGPRGKVPWVELDGTALGDSDLIVDRLAALHPDLPEALRFCTAGQHPVVRMLEEHLYWALVYFRWQDDAGFAALRGPVFGVLPRPIAPLAAWMVRRQVRKQLRQQGMGRFAPDEVLERARRDLEAAAQALGAGPFFAGPRPGRIDATAYGILTNIVDAVPPSPLTALAARYPRLAAYTARMREAAGFA